MENSPPWVTQAQTPANIMKTLQETKLFSEGVGKQRLEKFQNWLNDAKQGKPNVSFSQGLELLDSLHGIVREKITPVSTEYGQIAEAFNSMRDTIKRGDVKQIGALALAANERFGVPEEKINLLPKTEKTIVPVPGVPATSIQPVAVAEKQELKDTFFETLERLTAICSNSSCLTSFKPDELLANGSISKEFYVAYSNKFNEINTNLAIGDSEPLKKTLIDYVTLINELKDEVSKIKGEIYSAKINEIDTGAMIAVVLTQHAQNEIFLKLQSEFKSATNQSENAKTPQEREKIIGDFKENMDAILQNFETVVQDVRTAKTPEEAFEKFRQYGIKVDTELLLSILSTSTIAQNSPHLNLNASQTAFYNFMFFTMTQQNLNLQAEQRRLLEKSSASYTDTEAFFLSSSLVSGGSREGEQKRVLEQCRQNEPLYSFIASIPQEDFRIAMDSAIAAAVSGSIQIILPPGHDFHPGASFGGAGNLGSVQLIEKLLGENKSIKEKGYVIPSTQEEMNTILLPAILKNEQTENTTLAPLPQISPDLSQAQKFHAICRVLNEKKNEIESVAVEIIPNPYQTN